MRFVILILIVFSNVQGYRRVGSEKDAVTSCKYQKHLVLNPQYSCCNSELLKNGLAAIDWETCLNTEGKGETVQKAAWDVYKCVVEEANNKESSITLSQFAKLVSGSYPTDIGDKITEKASSHSDSANINDENFAALDKLRILYYNIEREVCEGKSVPLKVTPCSNGDEPLHRGGECCSESSFPFPVMYRSRLDDDLTESQVGCRKRIAGKLTDPKLIPVFPETMEVTLGEMCDSMCEMYNMNHPVWGPIVSSEVVERASSGIKSFLPQWLPSQIAQEAIEFAKQKIDVNGTIEAMTFYEFPDAVPGNWSKDRETNFYVHTNNTLDENNKTKTINFALRTFPTYLLHIPVHCTIVKQLLAYAEMDLTKNKNCEPPALSGESPADESPTTTDAPSESESTESSNDSDTTPDGGEGGDAEAGTGVEYGAINTNNTSSTTTESPAE